VIAPVRRPTRRAFLKGIAAGSAGAAWIGGAGLLLRDERWSENRSYWVARGLAPVSPPLRGAADADLIVIGGGVTGLSAAIHARLADRARRVLLLEARHAGFGATGRSGGVIGGGTEMGDPEGTADTVDLVLSLIDRFGIDCDLERHGDTTLLDPYRYAAGLKRAAESIGVQVHEGSRVTRIRDGAMVEVTGDGFSARAPRAIVATNGYTPALGLAVERIFPVHTGAAVTVPLPPAVLDRIPSEIHVMTSREMYMWGRKVGRDRLLVGSGAEYSYDNGLVCGGERFMFAALRRFLDRTWPVLRAWPFAHAWTGPMGCTADQEPIVGRIGDRGAVLYGGAYSGHGLAMGTKTGLFLAGWIDGRDPPRWMLRPTFDMPGEPLRYIGVNAVINLMNLGWYSMPKREAEA
jgi:glycine/D-amino acid oxidase-like deaminating enzyme